MRPLAGVVPAPLANGAEWPLLAERVPDRSGRNGHVPGVQREAHGCRKQDCRAVGVSGSWGIAQVNTARYSN